MRREAKRDRETKSGHWPWSSVAQVIHYLRPPLILPTPGILTYPVFSGCCVETLVGLGKIALKSVPDWDGTRIETNSAPRPADQAGEQSPSDGRPLGPNPHLSLNHLRKTALRI